MTCFSFECSFSTFINLAKHFSPKKCALLLSGDQPHLSPSHLFLFPNEEISVSSPNPNPWDALKKKLIQGPWVGYLAYEMGAYSQAAYTLNLPSPPIPLAYFFKPTVHLTFQKDTLFVRSFSHLEGEKALFSSARVLKRFLKTLSCSAMEKEFFYTSLVESDDQKSYISKIKKAKEHIISGDTYQINLSRSSKYHFSQDPFDFFIRLFEVNPTPLSSYINCEAFQILSASPECFLKQTQNRLETRPIKGTSKRGKSPQEDQLLQEALLNSPKEAAELSMICDLMRNDLGRVSEIGSVSCLKKKNLLKLSNVFHLESIIQSKPLQKHPVDLIRACFPAGSITGCPKKRAIEIICDLEKRARHIYCGSIGYFKADGDFEFNVAIRTALFKENVLEVQMGGAITYDSQDISEYQETNYKGGPFYSLLKKGSCSLKPLA